MVIVYIEIILLLISSFLSDVFKNRIKNSITFGFSVLGMLTNLIISGFNGLASSVLGWLFPVVLLFILYALRMLGAGDIKFFSAVGAIAGWHFVIPAIIYSFVFGGIEGLFILVFDKNASNRFNVFYTYVKSCFLSLSLMEYEGFNKSGRDGTFPFMYAAVPGTLFQMLAAITGIQVVKLWM
ncbi:MAG: A24 family peptidase [Bacillota bacterium]|nr:A24 family peptidase [Bacillota bacterium]